MDLRLCHWSQWGCTEFVPEHCDWSGLFCLLRFPKQQQKSKEPNCPVTLWAARVLQLLLVILPCGSLSACVAFLLWEPFPRRARSSTSREVPSLQLRTLKCWITRHPHSCWRRFRLRVKYCWRWGKVAETGPPLHLVRRYLSITHPLLSSPPICSLPKTVSESCWMSHVPPHLPKADTLDQSRGTSPSSASLMPQP